MNSVELVGRLAKDPVLNQTNDGKSVVNFTIAVDKGFGKKEADFFRIVVWGKQAESCATYKKKGDRVSIRGRLSNNNYELDGVKYYVTEVIANSVNYLDNAKRNDSNTSETENVKNQSIQSTYNNSFETPKSNFESSNISNDNEIFSMNSDAFGSVTW